MLPNSDNGKRLSLTPHFPTFKQEQAFLNSIKGERLTTYVNLRNNIWELVGTPQATSDWTNPEEWIPSRLHNKEKELALKIWRESQGIVNPRYTQGSWILSQKHNLLERNPEDNLELTQKGQEFLKDPEGESVIEIDQNEGLLNLLQIVSEHSPGRRGEILPSYIEFCMNFTKYQAESVHKSSLYDRLVNLVDRKLIQHDDQFYSITEKGLERVKKYSGFIIGRTITTEQSHLHKTALKITKDAREGLYNYLSQMDPYKFELLVKLLLEEMGYENVQATSQSNDGGVDVIADIELGITSVHEVVQVKRRSGTINRPVLDQLRGSLYRFRAMRGTIITIGKFAAGAKKISIEQGVAPITLIDGEKLLDLLMEYEIGISKKTIDFFEFDDSKLIQFEERVEDGVQTL